jgi:hypothetical protein
MPVPTPWARNTFTFAGAKTLAIAGVGSSSEALSIAAAGGVPD